MVNSSTTPIVYWRRRTPAGAEIQRGDRRATQFLAFVAEFTVLFDLASIGHRLLSHS